MIYPIHNFISLIACSLIEKRAWYAGFINANYTSKRRFKAIIKSQIQQLNSYLLQGLKHQSGAICQRKDISITERNKTSERE